MAIIIDKGFETSDQPPYIVHSIFGNKIIKFHSDATTSPLYALIDDFKIYPDANGYFNFNMKHLWQYKFKSIMFPNYADDIWADREPIPQLLGGITDNRFASENISTEIKVYISENTYETYVFSQYKLTLAYFDYLEKNFFEYSGSESLYFFGGTKITIFEGFPYDTKILNAISVDGISVGLDDRVLLSYGNNIVNEGVVNVEFVDNIGNIGFNHLEIVIKNCNGIQLKWLGNGTWKYWVFESNYKEEIFSKDLGQIVNDFHDDNINVSPYISLGKTAVKRISLSALNLEKYEIDYLSDIIISPKIYLNKKRKGNTISINDYLEVKLLTNKITVQNYKSEKYKLDIIIEIIQKTIK